MRIERIVFVLILVGVVFVAIIALFVYKTFTPESETRYVPTDSVDIQDNESGGSEESREVPPFADSHNALDDCIELKANEAMGKTYEPGSLLVTFLDLVSYPTAVESLRILGLEPDTSDQARQNYQSYRWLSVTVPAGEEFRWQCVLDSSEGVKTAGLNLTFWLRQ